MSILLSLPCKKSLRDAQSFYFPILSILQKKDCMQRKVAPVKIVCQLVKSFAKPVLHLILEKSMCQNLCATLTTTAFHTELFKKDYLQNIALENAALELCSHVPIFMHTWWCTVYLFSDSFNFIKESCMQIKLESVNNSITFCLHVTGLSRLKLT